MYFPSSNKIGHWKEVQRWQEKKASLELKKEKYLQKGKYLQSWEYHGSCLQLVRTGHGAGQIRAAVLPRGSFWRWLGMRLMYEWVYLALFGGRWLAVDLNLVYTVGKKPGEKCGKDRCDSDGRGVWATLLSLNSGPNCEATAGAALLFSSSQLIQYGAWPRFVPEGTLNNGLQMNML